RLSNSTSLATKASPVIANRKSISNTTAPATTARGTVTGSGSPIVVARRKSISNTNHPGPSTPTSATIPTPATSSNDFSLDSSPHATDSSSIESTTTPETSSSVIPASPTASPSS